VKLSPRRDEFFPRLRRDGKNNSKNKSRRLEVKIRAQRGWAGSAQKKIFLQDTRARVLPEEV
jgi:hypothetical protein